MRTIQASQLNVTGLGPLGDHQVKLDGPLAGPVDGEDLGGPVLSLNDFVIQAWVKGGPAESKPHRACLKFV